MSSHRRAGSPPFRASDLNAAVKGFLALPPRLRLGILLAGAVCLAVGLAVWFRPSPEPLTGGAGSAAAADGKGYLFCFWNAENFFDDVEDRLPTQPDKDYDAWFARDDARVFKQKLKNLTEVILKMNEGKGPDILALAEVENQRAAEKLRDSLNDGLKDPRLHYKDVLYKNPNGGRHIATAIITRLDVIPSKTQLLGRRQRILEAHLTANGHELVVVASHWTSRVSSKGNKEGEGRDLYARNIRTRFDALYRRDPKVDFLVCGDFNDTPEDESVVEYLKAIGDRKKVREGGDNPFLLNLFADRGVEVLADKSEQKEPGTHNYRRQWLIFDQIVVSPGLLDDEGWSCDPDSARIVNNLTAVTRGRNRGVPDDFGSQHDKISLDERGYSDHFPVTVRLKVAEAK
jgi:endonuclease/exonuclease/phosphatase family metal-dependent hydrolase